MPKTFVFDVNETLLDLAALEPLFGRVFNDAKIRHPWFR
jgi:2-haloacid dehalogenase